MLRSAKLTSWIGLGALLLAAPPLFAEIIPRERSVAPEVRSSAGQSDETSGTVDAVASPARVTISRAADLTGRPVYYSQSRNLGGAGTIMISSRSLPATAVFSVALRPRVAPSVPGAISLASLPSTLPVAARAMTSGFGLRQHPVLGTLRAHNGLDLAAPLGSPIVATSDGTVGAASWYGGYGLFVALDHENGVETRYGHMSRLNVVRGQQVRKGDVIGYVGSTGRSTGPHLHYEIRVNGRPIDPARHMPRR